MRSRGQRSEVRGQMLQPRTARHSVSVVMCLIVALGCLLTSDLRLLTSVSAQGHGAPQAIQPIQSGPPKALENVGIDQRLGEQLPLDVILKDELGRDVKLSDYFGKRPVILALVYYECPMLCNQVLNGLLSSISVLSSGNLISMGTPLNVGEQFDVVAISFDARESEKPGLAAEKRQSFIERYNRPGSSQGWHFLTGKQDSINRVTEAVGFRYAYDEATNQFAHASGVMVVTPDGKLARYFYGVEYAPKDIKLGLVEASDERIGTPVDRLLLYCYHYDPSSGTYTAKVAMTLIRLGGVLTLISIAFFYFMMRRRKIRLNRFTQAGGAA